MRLSRQYLVAALAGCGLFAASVTPASAIPFTGLPADPITVDIFGTLTSPLTIPSGHPLTGLRADTPIEASVTFDANGWFLDNTLTPNSDLAGNPIGGAIQGANIQRYAYGGFFATDPANPSGAPLFLSNDNLGLPPDPNGGISINLMNDNGTALNTADDFVIIDPLSASGPFPPTFNRFDDQSAFIPAPAPSLLFVDGVLTSMDFTLGILGSLGLQIEFSSGLAGDASDWRIRDFNTNALLAQGTFFIPNAPNVNVPEPATLSLLGLGLLGLGLRRRRRPAQAPLAA